MATSTNYGWAEPDNTSLVKDGALAIRTLGNAIDTSLWNSGYGQAGKNKIINSDMSVFQRSSTPTTGLAVTSTSTSFYGLDRWQIFSASTGRTVSRQVTGDTTNLPFIQYCQRIARDSGNTNTAAILPAYSMETASSIPYAGKSVTVSFYARKGANYSATASALAFVVRTGTGTDQNLNAGYTGSVDPFSGTATLTTTWQRFSASGTIAATVTEIGVQFNFSPTGTAGAADYFEITGVQLEVGSLATPFQTASGGSIQNELAMCQRYCLGANASGNAYTMFGAGHSFNSATSSMALIYPPATMRVIPTSISYANLALSDGATTFGITALTVSSESSSILIRLNVSVASGLTTNRTYDIVANNNTSAYFILSAEL